MTPAELDSIVTSALAFIVVILSAFGVAFLWTLIALADPDPSRLSIRLLLWAATKVDNATWPGRSIR